MNDETGESPIHYRYRAPEQHLQFLKDLGSETKIRAHCNQPTIDSAAAEQWRQGVQTAPAAWLCPRPQTQDECQPLA